MIDGDGQISAVARAVADREVDGRLAKVVVLEQTYATSIEDLWDAVTSVERLPRWFAPVSGDLREGGQYSVEGNASGSITACEPPRAFDATWEFGGAVSWIEVRLEAMDDGHARLSLSHIAHPDEHWKQFGPGAVGIGWDLSLLGLQLHLASKVNRPEDAGQWAASAKGLAFMVESGNAWCDADVGGGEDDEVARAAADRTIAFYTQPPEGE